MTDFVILLATPTRDNVSLPYLKTIVGILNRVHDLSLPYTVCVSSTSSSNIVYARNYFVNMFLDSSKYTHLFFVDSDTGFEPELLQKMIEFDKPFVSALSPSRIINPDRVARVAKHGYEPRLSMELASNFVCKTQLIDQSTNTNNGFKEAKSIGMSTTLLRRDVLETLKELYPNLIGKSNVFGKTKTYFQPFTPCTDESGILLSEDLSFSKRWTDIGGKIWVNISENITHAGTHNNKGNYLQNLMFLPPNEA